MVFPLQKAALPVLFALVCIIWGTTWLAMKLGVAVVPPVFFGGTRFVAAGSVLLAYAWLRGSARPLRRAETGRLVLVQLLMIVLTYGPLFWAIPYVPSGLAAVLDLALMPVCLLGFGLLLGEERWTPSRVAAVVLGFAGLGVLFGPEAVAPTDLWGLAAAAAIVFSTAAYSLGSVVARPLATSLDAAYMSGLTILPGGLALTLGALAFEPGAAAAASFGWTGAAWGGWLFLVVFGSLVAFTGYVRLIAAWGPARAGSYAYVSPVLAVVVGVLLLGESVGVRQCAGMALLLVAAFFSLGAPAPPPLRPEAEKG